MNQRTSGFLLIFLATVLWSTPEVVIRVSQAHATPLQFAWIRFMIASGFLLILLPAEMRRRKLHFEIRTILHSAWLSLFGIVIGGVLYQYSLRYAGAGVVAAVYGASPLAVVALSVPLLNETFSLARLTGILLGFSGIAILAWSEPSVTFSLFGLFLTILACLSFCAFTVFVKKYAGAYSGLPFTSLCVFWGALLLTPLVFIENETSTMLHWKSLVIPMLYLGIFTTGLTYLFYFIGIDRIETGQAASLLMIKPPLAAVIAWICLGEPITWNLLMCILFIAMGLYFVLFADRFPLFGALSQTRNKTRHSEI